MALWIDWMVEDGPVYWSSYRAPLLPERKDLMSQTHDADHQKLLDLGIPQHALDTAQRRGIGGGRILDLLKKLLPPLLEFIGDNSGGVPPPGPTVHQPPGTANPPGRTPVQAEPKSAPKK